MPQGEPTVIPKDQILGVRTVERHAQHRQLVRVVAAGATTSEHGFFSTVTKDHLVNGMGGETSPASPVHHHDGRGG
jgi:hypothetical protein